MFPSNYNGFNAFVESVKLIWSLMTYFTFIVVKLSFVISALNLEFQDERMSHNW